MLWRYQSEGFLQWGSTGKFLIFGWIQLKFRFWHHEHVDTYHVSFSSKKTSNKKLSPKKLWQTNMKWTVVPITCIERFLNWLYGTWTFSSFTVFRKSIESVISSAKVVHDTTWVIITKQSTRIDKGSIKKNWFIIQTNPMLWPFVRIVSTRRFERMVTLYDFVKNYIFLY